MSTLLSFEEARERLLAATTPVTETRALPTMAAAGRVLASAQYSLLTVPPLDNSAMDGYAVRCADASTAGVRLPISQRIPAGQVGQPLQPGSAARIFTGAPIPAGADAVVMQERCQFEPDDSGHGGWVSLQCVPQAGDNIRRAGEDISPGTCILPAGRRLRPQDTALAASVGLASLPVFRRVRVAVFFTGDELRMPGEPLPPGSIYNTNRFALIALLERLGCEVTDLGQVPDQLAATRAALREAAPGNDLIITSGGVSVGEEDHVKAAVEAEGRLQLWKIAIKPGKPLAYGRVTSANGETPFVGLPGNPVAAYITFAMLVRPLLLRLAGIADVLPRSWPVVADFAWPRPGSKPETRREFLRTRLNADGRLECFPNPSSGVLTSLVWADGLVDVAPQQVIAPGDVVRFYPFAELID